MHLMLSCDDVPISGNDKMIWSLISFFDKNDKLVGSVRLAYELSWWHLR
jgi:hypothetical protein